MKSLLLFLFLILAGCSSKNIEERDLPKSDTLEISERSSVHREDWEENKDEIITNKVNSSDLIHIENTEKITESSSGKFQLPLFSQDGNYLYYTNDDYSQIWRYNLESRNSQKIVEMQSAGTSFQISYDGKEIYYRNRDRQGKKSGGVYSIFKYTDADKKNVLLFKTEEHITNPVLIFDRLYFLSNGIPKSFNLTTNRIGSEFKAPFFYVKDDYLIKHTGKSETISPGGKNYKFINCKYSADLGFISALTANNGILVFDIEGNFLRAFKNAVSLDKLSHSNLVVFSVEEDDGTRILSSELYLGFLNSDKIIKIENPESESRFNPVWAASENMIAYSDGSGQIKTISLNIGAN